MGQITAERQELLEAELVKIDRLIEAIDLLHSGASPATVVQQLGMKQKRIAYVSRRVGHVSVIVRTRRVILMRSLGRINDEAMMGELLALPLIYCIRRVSPRDRGRPDGDDVIGRALDDKLLSWGEYRRLVARKFTFIASAPRPR